MSGDATLNAGQRTAKEQLIEWAKASVTPAISLSGPAGTGKSWMLRHILPDLTWRFPNVLLTATTGKAALRLAELTERTTTTLHKQLYQVPDDETNKAGGKLVFDKLALPPKDCLLVIDESSMITPDVWTDLQKWIKEFGVRILFVGDGFQLPPVIDSAKDEDFNIFGLVPGPRLTRVMRNGDAILDAATSLRLEGKLRREDLGAYRWRRGKLHEVLGEWLQAPSNHAIITWRNKVRMAANRVVRKAKGFESQFPTPNEPILVRRNGRGFLNGQIVDARDNSKPGPKFGEVQTSWLKVVMDDGKERLLFASCGGREESMDGVFPRLDDDEWKKYLKEKRAFEYGWGREHGWKESPDSKYPPRMDPLPITWGYVLTCHAGQGSEWDRVTVYLEELDTSMRPFLKPSMLPDGSKVPFYVRWLYTALTRAKKQVDVVIGG